MYRESEERELAREAFGTDQSAFLAACEIELQIEQYNAKHEDRVAELVQRTNQLNFSGRKHTRAGLEIFLTNAAMEKYVLSCRDRYGDYGTIGFCVVGREARAILVHDFMLSCRVQGKMLEQAFFHHLWSEHNSAMAEQMWVNFQPTERNGPALSVLKRIGFNDCVTGLDTWSNGMVLREPSVLGNEVVRVSCVGMAEERSAVQAVR
jgi:FkbH-like protein